jgi:hypothetical protein
MLCPSRAGEGLVGEKRKKDVVLQGGKVNSDTNDKQDSQQITRSMRAGLYRRRVKGAD